ncbi:hypothetical protein M5C99_04950 [Acidovorax sp. NCPPB 2350]|nr:hypothetical protein M5C99_04950 [Acidovorax sp. NCPPB 2350]
MHPWERRLRDLAQLLKNCGDTYFSPDRFRQNTNQFLQTSRTVTFIIQKHKVSIPGFEVWYQGAVIGPWKDDKVMSWAKDARNVVEKEGDLEMHSSLQLEVLYSYLSDQDTKLDVTRKELLGAGLDTLLKRALEKLPPGIASSAALKIQRKWIANSLPDRELIYALTYAYAQHHRVCSSLASHLNAELDRSVPHPTAMDPASNDVAKVRVMKLAKPGLGRHVSRTIKRSPTYQAPVALLDLKVELDAQPKPSSLKEVVAQHARIAQVMFELDGYHIPVLALYDEQWRRIDTMSTKFADQAEKFVFWRNVADRAYYLKAYAMVWTCESWMRDMTSAGRLPMHELPLTGEQLLVVGADAADGMEAVSWSIQRPEGSQGPVLERHSDDVNAQHVRHFFVEPVVAAMKMAHAARDS